MAALAGQNGRPGLAPKLPKAPRHCEMRCPKTSLNPFHPYEGSEILDFVPLCSRPLHLSLSCPEQPLITRSSHAHAAHLSGLSLVTLPPHPMSGL